MLLQVFPRQLRLSGVGQKKLRQEIGGGELNKALDWLTTAKVTGDPKWRHRANRFKISAQTSDRRRNIFIPRAKNHVIFKFVVKSRRVRLAEKTAL